ncbi:MAG: 7TM diverse intracellular signaling domain-containing protein [Rariglobus sp.]
MGVLGWLLFGFAGGTDRVTALPDGQRATVDYLRDRGGRLTVDEAAGISSGEWRRWSDERCLQSKWTDEVIWLKVTLHNPGARPLRGVVENLDYFADRADAWIEETEGGRLHLVSGEAVAAKEKAFEGREVAWPVTVPAGRAQVVYLRFENVFGVFVQPGWWADEAAFHTARMRSGLAEGIYLGGMLALFGYTALLWLRLRAADIGWYVLYLGTVAVFMFLSRAQLPGTGHALGSPGLEIVIAATIALSGVFLVQFARVFLELPARFPKIDRWAVRGWIGALLALVLAILAVTAWSPTWAQWMRPATQAIGVTHAGLLVLAVMSWKAGVRQARFFVLSFGCLFAGSLPMVVIWFFDAHLRDVAMRGLMIGSALEMLLLSLALADRFVRTQRRLVEETEQRRMIEAAYADELAEEVRERTHELLAANADKDRILAVIGHDLRSPLTGLMRSADEASGEFARDVARTGRTLLLMIEDLVQWARLRAGTRLMAVHRASALTMPAVALHHALAEADGVELTVEVPEELRIETDLVLAQTLVRNLLANALKFARTRVVLSAKDDGAGCVWFTVFNDGPELPPAVAARLVAGEDGPLTATGGMGLRLCREICRALGMRLEAGSGANGGTEFRFTLKKTADVEGLNP